LFTFLDSLAPDRDDQTGSVERPVLGYSGGPSKVLVGVIFYLWEFADAIVVCPRVSWDEYTERPSA
jgi:hypothetical protein